LVGVGPCIAGLLEARLSVSFPSCISRFEDAGSCGHLLRGVCSGLVYQLSRVSRCTEQSPSQCCGLSVDDVQQWIAGIIIINVARV